MGVILKVLHRSEKLKKAPFRNLFLDMEENIHIHYRDLRIELSRGEFEDIVNTFTKQSAELMKAIKDSNYQDGVLPNANHEELRIWTDSRLENDVVYHPHRISLEECTDGFHLHLRNYKLLLERDDFHVLVQAFKDLDLDAPHASTMDEIVELLDANDLHYHVEESNDGAFRLTVASYHEPKIRPILVGIGMDRTASGRTQTFTKDALKIVVDYSRDRADFKEHFVDAPRTVTPLTTVLAARDKAPDPNWLNAMKARVLDTFTLVANADGPLTMNLDFNAWLYDGLYDKVIFPFDPAPEKTDIKRAYRDWSKFLSSVDMYFVKPSKVPFNGAKQKALYDSVLKAVNRTAAAVPAISKIWIMGSALNGTMGFYKSPFIHSEWAKLASDVDLLIEMDDSKTFTPPEDWTYINVSSTNGCAIFHIGELPFSDVFGHRKEYPNLKYFDHLIDAYVYFPAKGNKEKKDAFLEKFKARPVFDRADEINLRTALESAFGSTIERLQKLDVATENDLYEVSIGGRNNILKVYRVSGNYSSTQLAAHTAYECQLVGAIKEFGGAVAAIRKTTDGHAVFEINGSPAVLFEKLDGEELTPPHYPVAEAAQALAHYHVLQIDNDVKLDTDFTFDPTVDIWHVEFERFAGESEGDEKLVVAFDALRQVHTGLKETYGRISGQPEVRQVHNHGDVQPRNFIMMDGTPWLFDFQNAFHGPRIFDLVEGAIEFSWGLKDPKDNDFQRYDEFVAAYIDATVLSDAERDSLNDALKVIGTIKFIKEVRMIKGDAGKNNLRRRRALDLADFMRRRLTLETTA